MSIRTIIEINHDTTVHIDMRPEDFMEKLGAFLRSADKRNAAALERYGFNIVESFHHSTDRKVVVEDREYPL